MHQKSYCDMLEDEFKDVMCAIAEKYEYKLIQEASHISATLLNLIEIEQRNPEKWGLGGDKTEKQANIIDYIDDEMNAADKYYNKFKQSNDQHYMQLAKEELYHAKILIDKARPMAQSPEDKALISSLTDKYNVMAQTIL